MWQYVLVRFLTPGTKLSGHLHTAGQSHKPGDVIFTFARVSSNIVTQGDSATIFLNSGFFIKQLLLVPLEVS